MMHPAISLPSPMPSVPPTTPSRRDVLRTGVAGAALGGLAPWALAAPRPSRDDVLTVGLVGCGGRGAGAAANALLADPNARLVAVGDTFEDMARHTLATLRENPELAPRIDVGEGRIHVGFEAYRHVIDAADVVLLATPPHFRPAHLAYAVAAKKHVFAEKPVAVDAPGARSVMDSCRVAAEKGLSLVSGLCYRYQLAKRETMRRIAEGMVGGVRTLQCTYNAGGLWYREPEPAWSEMELQVRNWLYYTWLSGDHVTEQHVHSLDKLAWAMGDTYPVRATASGGRSRRTEPRYGNVYDHFNTVYEWESGVVGFSSCRQWSGCSTDVSDHVYGTEGVASIQEHVIRRDDGTRWRYETDSSDPWAARRGGVDDMYQNELDALFWSIRAGEPIHDGEHACKSTMMAIMARMSAYTGKTVTWEEAWNSTLDLSPPAYEWGDAPVREVAVPGVTKFI